MAIPFYVNELADNTQSPKVSTIFVAIVQEPIATVGVSHSFQGNGEETQFGVVRSDVFGNAISDQKRTGGIAT